MSGGRFAGGRIQLDVLGPIRARRSGLAVPLGGTRQQALLLRLVLERGAVVSSSQLERDIWPDRDVTDSAIRVAIVRLRKALRDDLGDAPVVVHRGAGYAVVPERWDLDLDRFESAVALGQSLRSTDPARAAAVLREALDLWRGDPFGDLADHPRFAAESERLVGVRRRATEWCFEAQVRLGQGSGLVHDIEVALQEDPLSESLVASLAISLYQAGRQVDALAVYRRHERELRTEMGLRPSPHLQRVQQLILDHAEELSIAQPATMSYPVSATTRRFLSSSAMPLVGREHQLEDIRSMMAARADPMRRFVCVAGQPGTGKTHLMAVAAGGIVADGGAVVYAACSDGPTNGVQFVFDLAAGLGIDLYGDLNSASDPLTRGFETRIAILRRLEQVAHGPVVIVADDLHWSDAETVSTIEFLMARSPSSVAWMLGYRSDTSHPPLGRLLRHVVGLGASLEVSLEPFQDHEIKALAVALGRDDVADFDDLVERVRRRSGGNPLFCVELLRDDGPAPGDSMPDRLASLIVGRLDSVSETAKQVCRTLVIAGQDVPVAVLGEVCSVSSADVLGAASELAAGGILDQPDPRGLRFRHELISTALRTDVSKADEESIRRRLIDVLRHGGTNARLAVEQLLELPYPTDEVDRDYIDRMACEALRDLLMAVDYGSALALADRYLVAVGTDRTGTNALAALLQVATVLIATGDVTRGHALHSIVLDRTNVLDDPALRGDALLASGPSALGGSSAPTQIRQAVEVLRLLPPDDHQRRIQLQCWTAHHHLNLGQLDDAVGLLDQARRELAASPSASLRALVLSVRVQATLLIDHPHPSNAYEVLRGHAALTGDVVSQAGVALLAPGHAFVTGSLDAVEEAQRALADIAEIMPRPDFRWMVLASRAAVHLARGDLESAAGAVADAESVGRRMGVEMAEPVARLQQGLLLWQRRELGQVAEILNGLARRSDASPLTVVLAGHAAMQTGERTVALEMFGRLDRVDALLEASAQTWPAVAALTARLADELCEPEVTAAMNRQLVGHLAPRRGTGLAIHGVAYFGTVDLTLAFLQCCTVDPPTRAEAFERAAALERNRGTSWWMDEALGLATSFRS